jgi:hypothetical protein
VCASSDLGSYSYYISEYRTAKPSADCGRGGGGGICQPNILVLAESKVYWYVLPSTVFLAIFCLQ